MGRKAVKSIVWLVVVGLMAASAVAIAGATETKPEWAIKKGTEAKKVLKTGESESIDEVIETDTNWVFKQTVSPGIAIECIEARFAGEALITGPRGIRLGPILFETCSVTAPAGDTTCEVESTGFPNGEIRTQALGFEAEVALEGSTSSPLIKLAPVSTREEIVTIQLKGASCANAGGYEVAGKLVGKIDSSSLSTSHEWEFTKTSGTTLKIGGKAAEFTGTGAFILNSKNTWGDV